MSGTGLFDLAVIGGGINGAGIARDAAGRGLSVLLVEADDLARATSSASSKLIHGGLRYLEQYEFRLVREALTEREVLLAMAPHIIWPLAFALPHQPHLRPAWMIRAGLFLYDHLGGRRKLPGSRGVDLRRTGYGAGLRPELTRGFVYSDCWVDDARLVVLNAMDAQRLGTDVRTRTECVSARRAGGHWELRLRRRDATEAAVAARALVNAAGPWADRVAGTVMGANRTPPLRHIKGSHIVVPRVHDGDHALILQNQDRRVVFVIPYEGRFSLIGTTDVAIAGDPAGVSASPEEIAYLCGAASQYLAKPVTPADVVWTYAGVRPLYDDGSANPSAVTRDYVLKLEADAGEAPALHVFGGKITTYRRLAEHALEKLATVLPGLKPAWTAGSSLPGGDMADADFDGFCTGLARRYPGLDPAWLRRLARRHGTMASDVLGDARTPPDLGQHFGAGLYAREIDRLRRAEWAEAADDVLWRRTKEGLHLTANQRAAVARYMA
ncbi:glycerol-3-phosphate dehydrogenase [Stella sp.]|uniref:glycerol-3-phosphate dehydrogenase n=1 Tax=Stella sp. TaxID=2912054 RepID=UPI0035AE7891